MFRLSRFDAVAAGFAVAVFSLGVEARGVDNEQFVRIRRETDGELAALETSVAGYRSGESDQAHGLQVDLVSAVHVGEKSYYAELNRRFKSYDAVLYELIAAKGVDAAQRRSEGASPVTMVQSAIRSCLGLEFQLDAIDYTANNFVHADMSPQEFSQSMKDRNESFSRLFLRALAMSYVKEGKGRRQRPPDLADMLLLVFDKARATGLRRLMAEQFGDMNAIVEMINGPEGSTLVTERNKVVIKVLREQINQGRRKFAVFYGGAHMPDIERRLVQDFHMEPARLEWLTAWDLRLPEA